MLTCGRTVVWQGKLSSTQRSYVDGGGCSANHYPHAVRRTCPGKVHTALARYKGDQRNIFSRLTWGQCGFHVGKEYVIAAHGLY